jgi:hypothetical protein
MASAWAVEDGVPLGRVAVGEQSGGVTAIARPPRPPELSAAIVTIGAMGCQERIAERVREGGGDDVPAVERGQPTPCERVREAVNEGPERGAADIAGHRAEEAGHGRRGART